MISIPEVKLVETSLLQEDGHNPNKMDKKSFEVLKKNIIKYGFLIPVITNKDYLVADGSHRLKAAKELKLLKVPVIAIPLKEVDRRIIRQVMNKLRGEHDKELDDEEYKFIFDEGSFEEFKELCCIDNKELVSFLDGKGEVVEDDFDTTEALTKPKYEVKLGDVWSLGSHRLMCGDSTNKEDVDKLMDNNIAILMVTDPPYGVNYDPKWRDEADKKGILGNRYPTRALGSVRNDERIDWSEAYELFNGNVAYIWHAGKYASEVAESIKKCNYEIISQIIWVKPHFALSRGDYHWRHEPCWYAVKKGKPHNWQGSRREQTVWEIAGMNAMGASHDEADKATGHGTQKPIECMSVPIRNNTNKEDIIYDCFGGSGSTLIACEKLNRKCYMMEIDTHYASVIIQRWEELTGKKAKKI